MQLNLNEIHIWSADLTAWIHTETPFFLSHDERLRAKQFRFTIHRQRFIAARSILKLILSRYLKIAPGEIVFSYNEYDKPAVLNSPLKFNMSHSENKAVYAIADHQVVGIDIEKIQSKFNPGVAKRFFTSKENQQITALSPAKQAAAFYQIWSCKEAVIKAMGGGFSIPLNSFSVSLTTAKQEISVADTLWNLVVLSFEEPYASAIASDKPIKQITYWQFLDYPGKIS